MRKKTLKAVTLAAVAGMMFQFGGCLNVNRILRDVAFNTAYDLVVGNNTILDLFAGGA